MSKNWMRLDNAALIFPAIRHRRWVNVFRVSATLTEPVDPAVLQRAVEVRADDTPETLSRRVLEEAEWRILSQSVILYCSGELKIHGNRVLIG